MKRPILIAGMFAGALGLAGCQQTPHAKESASKVSRPDDPTAWSSKDVTRGDSDSSRSGLPDSSGLAGSLSSEGRDIERSLGYGRR